MPFLFGVSIGVLFCVLSKSNIDAVRHLICTRVISKIVSQECDMGGQKYTSCLSKRIVTGPDLRTRRMKRT